MTRRRWTLVAVALAGGIAGGLTLIVALGSDTGWGPGRGFNAVVGPLVGWAFIGTGLFARIRRPESRVGLLMIAVGFAWCASALIVAEQPGLFVLGYLTIGLPYAVLYHLLLAFPVGSLHSTLERAIVVTGYFSAVVLKALETLFEDTGASPLGLPDNPLLVGTDGGVLTDVAGFRPELGVLLALGVVALLAGRWRAAVGSQRRALTPVLVSGGFVTALLALFLAAGVTGISGFRDQLEVARVAVLATIPFAFLGGLLHSRVVGASAVNRLVARLGRQGRPGDVRDELAMALGDPALTLLYWLPQRELYVDAAGRPAELPTADSDRVASVVEREGQPIAAIVHDRSLVDQGELVRAAGAAVSLVLENERLDAELRATVEEVQASRARIVASEDAARRRLERDLHDGAQQRLVSAALSLRMLTGTLDGDTEGRRELDSARKDLDDALRELRELARGIHPAVLSDQGLRAGLEGLANRAPLPVELSGGTGERYPENVEIAAYFVVAESLTNVAKHAAATHACVRVNRAPERVIVEVSDDGIGGADAASGSGLRGLADRVSALDGHLEVDSVPGRGTTVKAMIPCGS
jgi:signal transduction histidine kinase